ncbi:MAG: helix-turn-helix transcriptional regulator [Clostridia bacterium]|nr:helix-turn-helix transcriptional regulator [Clostridia bacterium]
MIINSRELCSIDCIFTDLVAYRMGRNDYTTYNYENNGRSNHLIFYQIENSRSYTVGNEHMCSIGPGDIVFVPQGTKYRSYCTNQNSPTDGIGISFSLKSCDGEEILLSDKLSHIAHDDFGQLFKRFKMVLYSAMNPSRSTMRLKGEMFSIIDELFTPSEIRSEFVSIYGDIMQAIVTIENKTNINFSTRELADMCHMSESSFLRKFKEYSGGITPTKYRNKIRLTHAEEMANSDLTLNEIAETLGFFDAAHLCKIYRQEKGHTLKKKNER